MYFCFILDFFNIWEFKQFDYGRVEKNVMFFFFGSYRKYVEWVCLCVENFFKKLNLAIC